MGTSSPFGGPRNDRPLIPSFVDDGAAPAPWPAPAPAPQDASGAPQDGAPGAPGPTEAPQAPPPKPAIPPAGPPNRFSGPRASFTSFAKSGGTDSRSLGKAVSGYVRSSMGSPRRAAQRMGTSSAAGGRVLSVLRQIQRDGIVEILRRLNLSGLAGRPIEEVFAGLADYVCPEGGSIDEGIARDAFVETIADLAGQGITEIDGLTPDQMRTVFELYVAHTIEARLCNDIGAKAVALPANPAAAQKVQDVLHDFIHRGVADAVSSSSANIQSLSPDDVSGFVTGVYESAFEILRAMGDAEGDR